MSTQDPTWDDLNKQVAKLIEDLEKPMPKFAELDARLAALQAKRAAEARAAESVDWCWLAPMAGLFAIGLANHDKLLMTACMCGVGSFIRSDISQSWPRLDISFRIAGMCAAVFALVYGGWHYLWW